MWTTDHVLLLLVAQLGLYLVRIKHYALLTHFVFDALNIVRVFIPNAYIINMIWVMETLK